jgi:hypothetical protein
MFNIGADVISLGSYLKQGLELVKGQIDSLPSDLKPKARSPYGG